MKKLLSLILATTLIISLLPLSALALEDGGSFIPGSGNDSIDWWEISGGADFNGNLLNALSRLVNTILELGRALGSSLRRSRSGKSC